MAALLLVHCDPRFLVSVGRMLERHGIEHVGAHDEREALMKAHEIDLAAVVCGATLRWDSGLALLARMRATMPLVGRFLVGPRIPADVRRHVESGLVHGHFSLPFDIADLLGYAGLAESTRIAVGGQRAVRHQVSW